MKRNIMSQERRYLTDKDKEEIGLQCCNCQSTEDLEYMRDFFIFSFECKEFIKREPVKRDAFEKCFT